MPAPSRLQAPPASVRWLVLVFSSLAMFGNYYVYDSIAPLADILRTQLGFSSTQIGTLNAIYSAPNIVMVLIGGVLVDRFGTRNATLKVPDVRVVPPDNRAATNAAGNGN